MPRIRHTNPRLLILAAVLAMVGSSGLAEKNSTEPQVHAASIGHGITLHYVEEGTGVPVIFVHGSLSDGGYWADQIGRFAKQYRAIAYSRRYNYPNANPVRRGYSAVVDSDDLAAFIHTLHLGKVVVIGHSYGALTGLFLAARHPEMVRHWCWRNRPPSHYWRTSTATSASVAKRCSMKSGIAWSRRCSRLIRRAIAKRGSGFSWPTSSTTPMRGIRCRNPLATTPCRTPMSGT
jgi:pimeloyl-ACP methyl ester carboxylesterase